MPLAFLEVKKPDNEGGIRKEFDRMINRRLQNPDYKKFFNLIQFVSFSNNIYRILNWQSPVYKNANTGSTVPHANRKFIESIKIPIAKDMTAYSNVFNEIYKKIIQNRQENKELILLRDFLLPLLMNGQVGFKN